MKASILGLALWSRINRLKLSASASNELDFRRRMTLLARPLLVPMQGKRKASAIKMSAVSTKFEEVSLDLFPKMHDAGTKSMRGKFPAQIICPSGHPASQLLESSNQNFLRDRKRMKTKIAEMGFDTE
jgi:hypothetical protein